MDELLTRFETETKKLHDQYNKGLINSAQVTDTLFNMIDSLYHGANELAEQQAREDAEVTARVAPEAI